MDMEGPEGLPILDLLVYWKNDGALGHKVYWKPAHTDLYLNGRSEFREHGGFPVH